MSLKKCPVCSGRVSSSAAACPHCGHNLAARRSWWWVLVIVAAMGLSMVFALQQDDVAAPVVTPSPAPAKPTLRPVEPIQPDQLVHIASGYQQDVAQMANLLQAQHPSCNELLDPFTIASAAEQGDPANPRYIVQCGRLPNVVVLHFTWMEAVNGTMPVQPVPKPTISQRAAADACEQAAKSGANIPATVVFSKVWDAGFRAHDDGTAIYISKFSAKNAFGVEHRYAISCDFTGLTLSNVSVSPSH